MQSTTTLHLIDVLGTHSHYTAPHILSLSLSLFQRSTIFLPLLATPPQPDCLFFSVGRRGGKPAPPSISSPPPPPKPTSNLELCNCRPSTIGYHNHHLQQNHHRPGDGRRNYSLLPIRPQLLVSMRKLHPGHGAPGMVSPLPATITSLTSSSSSPLFPPALSPLLPYNYFPLAPSPSPNNYYFESLSSSRYPISLFPSIPIANYAFDLATLLFIGGLILLSTLSLSLILHLGLRSRRFSHLQHFNYLWTVRLLLVTFASLWALNELLRLPIFRQNYLYPFLPAITLEQQANFCKVHAVLSLGFFEPGFLVTLLFLVNVSIKKRLPRRMWALPIALCASCSPILLLQGIFVFYSPFQGQLPKLMHGSSILLTDALGKKTVLCTYPFFSSAIFGAFAIAYSLAFLLSCWRVVTFVINKSIRARIDMLVSTLMFTLPMQILCLALTFLWSPNDLAYCFSVLTMFSSVAWLLVVSLVILVIKPISDALAAWGVSTSQQLSQVGDSREQTA